MFFKLTFLRQFTFILHTSDKLICFHPAPGILCLVNDQLSISWTTSSPQISQSGPPLTLTSPLAGLTHSRVLCTVDTHFSISGLTVLSNFILEKISYLLKRRVQEGHDQCAACDLYPSPGNLSACVAVAGLS